MNFFKKLFERNSFNATQCVIDIEVLCKLWLPKENHSDDQQTITTTPQQAEQQLDVPILSVYDALKDIISPVENLIKTRGMWSGLLKVFEIVEKYGSYPSVVALKDNVEYRSDIINILSEVTIKEHSIKVTRIMVNELKNEFNNIEGLILIAVLAGLMHDIGKAEPLRSYPQYSKYDHPKIGADLLKSCFVQGEVEILDFYEVNKAADIILNHHRASNEQIASLFQIADEKARVEELKFAHKIAVELKEKLSAGDIIKLIEPHINAAKSENDWSAFSYKDTVYVTPDMLYNAILKYSEENKILFFGQIKNLSKDYFIKNIVNMFKEADILAPVKLSHEKGSWFKVHAGEVSLRPFFLIPIKITAFDKMPSELEERKRTTSKNPLFKLIYSVVQSGATK